MLHACTKCDYKFTRKIDLDRHLARKTACYYNLTCLICSKKFTRKSSLINHMNKKTKCVNNESLKLIIQLEQTKLELAQTALQTKNASIVEKKLDLLVKDKEKGIEEIKLKQLKVSNKSQSTGGNVNINNFTFNVNVYNIDKMPKCNMTIEEANKLYSDDITQLIQNVLRFHYSSKSENNKCIKHLDKDYKNHNLS